MYNTRVASQRHSPTETESEPHRLRPARLKETKEGVIPMIQRILKADFWEDCQGQDLVEYALMAGMVAVAAVAAMPVLGATVNNVFSKIGSIITANVN